MLQAGTQEERSQKMSSTTQGKLSLLLRKETADRMTASGKLRRMEVVQMKMRMRITPVLEYTRVERGLQMAGTSILFKKYETEL